MNPLLEQFISEAREFLQGIGESLMALESEPDSKELMGRLFRLVHTLKGNSSLFTLPPMTRVLHAAEDLMDAVRDGHVAFSRELADQLLEAMDFVSHLTDELEANGSLQSDHAGPADHCASSLRRFLAATDDADVRHGHKVEAAPSGTADTEAGLEYTLSRIPEDARLRAWQLACSGTPLLLVIYRPADDCFYKGEDPFFQARNIPGLIWGTVEARSSWPELTGFDCYVCNLDFHALTGCDREEISVFFRYNPDEIQILAVPPEQLIQLSGHADGPPLTTEHADALCRHFARRDHLALAAALESALAAQADDGPHVSALRWLALIVATRPELTEPQARLLTRLCGKDTPLPDSQPAAQLTAPDEAEQASIQALLRTQQEILALPDDVKWLDGRIRAAAGVIRSMLRRLGKDASVIDSTLAQALLQHSARPLHDWLKEFLSTGKTTAAAPSPAPAPAAQPAAPATSTDTTSAEREPGFGRRAEDALGGRVLKVDQAKVDRLMSLIGEMVVAKNSLPYLANRAEEQYGVRELAREIKAQYAVINRIAEEMQDAIMQVRMLPVSFIFQRFPRLVRDISRKLGKEVELRLEGEETEADKHIIESLADPLIHIVRNSLDHGLESPEARVAAGKPRNGRLTIRAHQESDRVFIEIEDDGRGIDPDVIKRKAYEKGLIDEGQLERLSDKEAIHLVFRAGFSTAETVTDLSGRGVGMDVVRNALEKVGGSIDLSSQVGRGTRLRLSLPLSMAVTNVMIIESDAQIFGVPMDMVVETVRLPRERIQTIKRRLTTVLRGRIIPLVSLNERLGIPAEPLPNADDELAALIVKVGGEQIGLLIDDFRETVDVILKPLPGALARLPTYAGSALLGDGSVLMVINPKELFQ